MKESGIKAALMVGALAAGAAMAAGGAAAVGTENIAYRYDARGRLVKVERSGNVNNGVNTAYSYDKANNRTNRNVTGVP